MLKKKLSKSENCFCAWGRSLQAPLLLSCQGKRALPSFFSPFRKFLRFFPLASLLLLTRCSLGPRHPVEGVSRSSRPYHERGEWHYPQQHYDYDKEGLASWYGPNFHGGKKAQGEIYNQYAMTAAHKTLPLPSIVRVTNLENGKHVVVLIDDRGPFKYKRIIDLSASAAKELGMYQRGICKVRVQALPKESHALAMYLKHYGRGGGQNSQKRTWEDIYRQEIGQRSGYENLTPVSMKVHLLNQEEQHGRSSPTKKSVSFVEVKQKPLYQKSMVSVEQYLRKSPKKRGGKGK
ncbi:hypothetical protein AGMMS49949_06570 [Alphaproteobacteria bacterium]|nr:hypothetical protein AGMMS49949_06570 [Alphaproteobacteria bacterium]GHS96932.1 hypothetical protein AGMMS50296_3460 [Alphaproteobacteria bacterium]